LEILATDFVLFRVSDLQAALDFYQGFLGLGLTFYKEEWKWAEMHAGNVTLTLCGGHEGGGSTIALAVDDLEGAEKEVQEAGVRVCRKLHELSTCWHLEVADPDGNTVILHKRKDGTHGQE